MVVYMDVLMDGDCSAGGKYVEQDASADPRRRASTSRRDSMFRRRDSRGRSSLTPFKHQGQGRPVLSDGEDLEAWPESMPTNMAHTARRSICSDNVPTGDEWARKIQALTNENSWLKAEVDSLKSGVASPTRNRRSNRKTGIDHLTEAEISLELENLHKENLELDDENRKFHSENIQLQEKVRILFNELDIAKRCIVDDVDSDISPSFRNTRSVKDPRKNRRSSIRPKHSDSEAEKTAEVLQIKVDAAHARLEKAHEELRRYAAVVATLESEKEQLQHECSELEATLASCSENLELEREHAETAKQQLRDAKATMQDELQQLGEVLPEFATNSVFGRLDAVARRTKRLPRGAKTS
eukprot:TRINITY_DN16422_c0_g1_i1.p1 TRINITY_DN16422_c0_g1~~TRINITY_DN16422_c0_g1_i1.p1  ORF type:complete len:355 (-),score=74.21 TRINITY_DN16422_c0_g1_i1:74-1138(-)